MLIENRARGMINSKRGTFGFICCLASPKFRVFQHPATLLGRLDRSARSAGFTVTILLPARRRSSSDGIDLVTDLVRPLADPERLPLYLNTSGMTYSLPSGLFSSRLRNRTFIGSSMPGSRKGAP